MIGWCDILTILPIHVNVNVNDVRKRMTDTCIHQLKSNFPLLSHFPTSENIRVTKLCFGLQVFSLQHLTAGLNG